MKGKDIGLVRPREDLACAHGRAGRTAVHPDGQNDTIANRAAGGGETGSG
jgi:hypothetical protein